MNTKIIEIITLFGYAKRIAVAGPNYKVIVNSKGEFVKDLILSNGKKEDRIRWWKAR